MVLKLIHVSEIKTGYVDSIYNVFKVGDSVRVQVIDYDEYDGKASLSMRSQRKRNIIFSTTSPFSNKSKDWLSTFNLNHMPSGLMIAKFFKKDK